MTRDDMMGYNDDNNITTYTFVDMAYYQKLTQVAAPSLKKLTFGLLD